MQWCGGDRLFFVFFSGVGGVCVSVFVRASGAAVMVRVCDQRDVFCDPTPFALHTPLPLNARIRECF